jgi:hypothetical protein|tara:strand:+ start:385 stop:618 length:234 start_codon:yes stop_codon:yes gene_type:complete
MKTVSIDINNNDTVIPLMAGALYDLHELVDDRMNALKYDMAERAEKNGGFLDAIDVAESEQEIRHYRKLRNRLANYL